MANSPENRYPDGQDMSRLWYGDPAEDPQAYNKDQTWEQWQNENIERNLSEWFGDDQTAIEIAKEAPMMDNESKEDFIKRIWNSAIRRDNAEKIAPARPDEALDEHNARASYLSQFDIDKPLWGQMNTEQKRDLLARYPKYEGENRADWQVRVEGLVGAKIWANTEQQPADAGDQAANTGTDTTTGGESGVEGSSAPESGVDGPAVNDGETGGEEPIADDSENPTDAGEASDGDAGEGDDDGAAEAGEDDAAEAGDDTAETGGKKPLRTDLQNFKNWSPDEQAALIAAIMTLNKTRRNGGAETGNNNRPVISMNEGGHVTPAPVATTETISEDDDAIEDDVIRNQAEKKGLSDRFRNSKIGKKLITLVLMAGILGTGGLLLSRNGADKNPGPQPEPQKQEETQDDEDPIVEGGEENESEGWGNYYYYECGQRGVEKSSDYAFCNFDEVLTDVIREHPEWSDFETNKDSYNNIMNAAQMKLAEDECEYMAGLAWRICGQTEGAYFSDFISPDMTMDEVEAVFDKMDAATREKALAELARAQGDSTWSAGQLDGEGFNTGINDLKLEKDGTEYIYDVDGPEDADLIQWKVTYDNQDVMIQSWTVGSIKIIASLKGEDAIKDGKGAVIGFDGGVADAKRCANFVDGEPTPKPDTPDNPGTPDNPPDTPDNPPDTPDNPPDTPDNPPDTPTPTPTPEGKTPLADKEGNEQEGTSSTGLTEKPEETEAVNPDTNAGASAAPENVEKAPDSSSQAGAGMNSETTKSQDGGTVAEKVNDGDKSGGENGENTAAQKNTEPQTEAKKKQQEEDNKGKAAEASSSSSNKKKPNKSAEQKSAENQAEEDKKDAEDWANGDFAI